MALHCLQRSHATCTQTMTVFPSLRTPAMQLLADCILVFLVTYSLFVHVTWYGVLCSTACILLVSCVKESRCTVMWTEKCPFHGSTRALSFLSSLMERNGVLLPILDESFLSLHHSWKERWYCSLYSLHTRPTHLCRCYFT